MRPWLPGIGILSLFASYAVGYALKAQLFGPGGSVLYWMTGNPKLGQPKGTTVNAGPPKSHSQTYKSGGFSGNPGTATGSGGGGAF